MLDLSLTEVILVVVVAVIFIGPKELPVVIKAVAKAMRGLRSLMSEIREAFDDMAKESGVKDVAEEMESEIRMIKGDDGKWYESYDMPDAKKDDKDV